MRAADTAAAVAGRGRGWMSGLTPAFLLAWRIELDILRSCGVGGVAVLLLTSRGRLYYRRFYVFCRNVIGSRTVANVGKARRLLGSCFACLMMR